MKTIIITVVLLLAFSLQYGNCAKIDELKKSAAKGNAEAQLSLGKALIAGENIHEDAYEGAKWIAKAVDQNNWAAKHYYGICLTYGIGVDKDPERAVNLLDVTVNPKSAKGVKIVWDAYNQLFETSYFDREDVGESERQKALKWIILAAENGIPRAKCLAAEMYHDGRGVTKDLSKSAKLMRAAAQSGYREAVNLADSYEYDAMNPIQRWMADKNKEKIADQRKKKIQEIQKKRKESEVADLLREIRDQNAELLNLAKESSEQVSSQHQSNHIYDDSSDRLRRESQDSADEIRREINQAQMWDAMQSRLNQ